MDEEDLEFIADLPVIGKASRLDPPDEETLECDEFAEEEYFGSCYP